jgi:hypothetical protein
LLYTITRWPVLQKVRGHTSIVLPLLVGVGFQVLFHSPPGVLFTFPSRYLFSIGHQVVFSLGRWSSHIPTGFLVSRGTLDTSWCLLLSYTGLSPSLVGLSIPLLLGYLIRFAGPNPRLLWFGLLPVRSPLLRKSSFLSFPQGT